MSHDIIRAPQHPVKEASGLTSLFDLELKILVVDHVYVEENIFWCFFFFPFFLSVYVFMCAVVVVVTPTTAPTT